jgi:rsbT antagonist protein RsbS
MSAVQMDSFIGGTVDGIAAMSRVLAAETVVVGMQPAVAIMLVEPGMSLPGCARPLNVEQGMALLTASIADPERRHGVDSY